MNYTITGKYNKYFELFDAKGISLARLDYPKWYAMRTATMACGGVTYEISPKGFFRTSSIITSGDKEVGSMKFNGLGKMSITMGDGPVLVFKRVGFFKGHMALFNEHDHEIIKITQTNIWAIWNRDYTVVTDDNYKEAAQPMLMLLLIYCIGYMRSMSHAG